MNTKYLDETFGMDNYNIVIKCNETIIKSRATGGEVLRINGTDDKDVENAIRGWRAAIDRVLSGVVCANNLSIE